MYKRGVSSLEEDLREFTSSQKNESKCLRLSKSDALENRATSYYE